MSAEEEYLEKLRYLDQNCEVSYEYDPTDAAIYISSSLSVERKLSDAVAGYLPLWTTTTAGFKFAGAQDVTIESLENFFEWGDQSVQYNHERRFTGLTPAGPSEKTPRRKTERLTVETGKLIWHQLQLGQT